MNRVKIFLLLLSIFVFSSNYAMEQNNDDLINFLDPKYATEFDAAHKFLHGNNQICIGNGKIRFEKFEQNWWRMLKQHMKDLWAVDLVLKTTKQHNQTIITTTTWRNWYEDYLRNKLGDLNNVTSNLNEDVNPQTRIRFDLPLQYQNLQGMGPGFIKLLYKLGVRYQSSVYKNKNPLFFADRLDLHVVESLIKDFKISRNEQQDEKTALETMRFLREQLQQQKQDYVTEEREKKMRIVVERYKTLEKILTPENGNCSII